jgi:hypothetical protein
MVAPDFTVAWTREENKKQQQPKKKAAEEAGEMGKLLAEVEALLPSDDDEEEQEEAQGGSSQTRGVVPASHDDEEEDEEEGPRVKAVISTSKRWLRERLRAAGIPFEMPLAPDAAARDTDEGPAPDVRAELEALLRHDWGVGGHATVDLQIISRRRRPMANAGGGEVPRHRSQLVVSGALAVHGLFTFLADLGHSLAPSAVGDVPRLLALKPFAHGVLGRLQVAANTPVQRTLLAAAQGGMEAVYQLRLRGPVLPSQLRRLAGVVHYFINTAEAAAGAGAKGAGAGEVSKGAMAEGDWTLTMEVAPGTEAFNNGRGEQEEAAMSMKEVRYHAEKGRYVTIRMTAPSPSSSSKLR